MRIRILSVVLASASALPLAALAQAAAPQAAAPASAATVSEVVVTAQKRQESLVNVPISVAAVSNATLTKTGVTDMSQLGSVVPGLHVDTAGAFFQPSIRGIGTAIAGAGASSNVATYVDGIYKPNQLFDDFDFIDVDSVQVLKGPQGTLFGRNATGGAVLVTTRTPSFTPVLEVHAAYGSFNTFSGSLYASDKITDNLAASIAVGGTRSNGWVTNIATGKSANPIGDVTGRIKLLFEPASGWKFTLTVDGFRVDDPSLYAASAYNGWSEAANFGVPLSVGDPRKVSLSGPIAHIAEGFEVALKSEVDLGFATLTSYTAGQWDQGHEYTNEMAAQFPVDGSPPISPALQVAVENADWNWREKTYSQEFDLGQSGKGPVDWVTGLFLFYDTTTYNPFNLGLYGPFGPGGELTGAPYPWPDSAYVSTGDEALSGFTGISYSGAVFGDATYNLGRWHFTVGGRYSIDRAGVEFTSYPSIANGFLDIPLLTNYHDFYSFTPRAIIRYSLTSNSSVYASYSQGTKAGLFNASGYLTDQQPLKPEKLTDYEAGYKIAGHHWRFEASGFYYDYKNLQVSTYIGGSAFFQNAPSAKLYGADAHWQADIGDHFDFDVGAAWTHARYTDFPNAALQTYSPIFGVVNSTTDVSGDVMERTPAFSGNTTATFHTPLAGGRFSLDANLSYQSNATFDFAGVLKDPEHMLLNLRAAWIDPSNKWTISVSGRNVTNTVYLVQVLPNAGGFGAVYGEPASVMFEVDYKY
jgi:iron complex outermembrane receptor protein